MEMQQWINEMRKWGTYCEMTNSLEYQLDGQQARLGEFDMPPGIKQSLVAFERDLDFNTIFSQKHLNY